MCSKRLSRASALIGGLGKERERWSEAEIKLMDKLENLTGDILLSAAAMAYLGPLTSAYRDKCTSDWVHFTSNLGIPCSSRFSLADTLGSAVRIEGWTEAGLPRDSFSIDNAVMVYHQKKWPLLIDPQGQVCCLAELLTATVLPNELAFIGKCLVKMLGAVARACDPTSKPIGSSSSVRADYSFRSAGLDRRSRGTAGSFFGSAPVTFHSEARRS